MSNITGNYLSEELNPTHDEELDALLTYYKSSPCAMAVFKTIMGDKRETILDAQFVYVNSSFCKWAKKDVIYFEDKTFNRFFGSNLAPYWNKNMYLAAFMNDTIPGRFYDPTQSRWISYVLSPIKNKRGYCLLSFFVLEHDTHEYTELEKKLRTNTLLLKITRLLSANNNFNGSITDALLNLIEVFNCDRVFLLETDRVTVKENYEVCRDGIPSTKHIIHNKPYDKTLKIFESFPAINGLIKFDHIEDLYNIDGVDIEGFKESKIKSLLAIPLYSIENNIIGYLGIDNYRPNDDYDINMMVNSLSASFRAKLIISQNIVRLHQLSYHDSLTGIYNRFGYFTRVNEYIEKNKEDPCVEVVLDIDDFKFINDLYGHYVGDQALIYLSKQIQVNFGPNAICGRTGGDEFAILIPGLTNKLAKPIIKRFADHRMTFKVGDQSYSFTTSQGYAEYPRQADNVTKLTSLADSALYSVKLKGKNNYQEYSTGLDLSFRSRLGFNLQDIGYNLPTALFVYSANEDGHILFANQNLVDIFECTDFDDFINYTNGNLKTLLNKEQFKQFSQTIRSQIADPKNNNVAKVKQAVKTKNGKTKVLIIIAHLVNHPHYGETFYGTLSEYFEL